MSSGATRSAITTPPRRPQKRSAPFAADGRTRQHNSTRAGRGLRLELVVVEVVGGALGHGVQVRHLLLLHVGRLARDDLVRDLVAAERAPALARAVALASLLEVAWAGNERFNVDST